jgi:hypothetical protein
MVVRNQLIVNSLYELLVNTALSGLQLQQENGSIPGGHNGPWNDLDTPVRTTAHWGMTFFKAFEITGNTRFCEAAIAACDYLISRESRPYGRTFYCRDTKGRKSMCNGLIGQAWAVEPLLLIGEALAQKKYLNVAIKVLEDHPYCEKRHGWSNVEIDGTILSFQYTFNQQVWFAAMAFLAGNRSQILRDRALDFYHNMPHLVEFLESYLFKHIYQPNKYPKIYPLQVTYQLIKSMKGFLAKTGNQPSIHVLSEGYHAFILYGLAMVENSKPEILGDSQSENGQLIQNAIDYALMKYPFGLLGKNEYAWSYNPIGIEMAYILHVFGPRMNFSDNTYANPETWLKLQFQHYFDRNSALMNRNTSDGNILAARIYEAVRLPDISISLPLVSGSIS